MTPSGRDPLPAYLLVQARLPRSRELPPVLVAHAVDRQRCRRAWPPSCAACPESTSGCCCWAPSPPGNGEFVPGGATQHALLTLVGTSPEACEAFLTNLVRSARDDTLARARAHGVLPRRRPS
jgi:hypothetical protein